MISLFDNIKSLVTVSKSVTIDNRIFHFHKTTSIILFAVSLLLTSGIYFTDPIKCSVDSAVERVIDMYCWIHATYTLPDFVGNKSAPIQAHPGVSHHSPTETVKFHKYYQWVCFVLFFQAIAFYIPRFLWKTWEHGRVKSLSVKYELAMDEEERNNRKKLVLEYFQKNLGNNGGYAYSFFFCEILNFANVMLQMHLTNMFVGYAFTTYGWDILTFAKDNPLGRTDPMARAFPKVTKCVFRAFGPGGNIIPYDALCVLPFNLINEKIYLFLWFWFLLLAIASGLALVYRLVIIFSLRLRIIVLRWRFRGPELSPGLDFETFVKNLYVGDWFLLYLMGKNMGPMVYTEFVKDLAERLAGRVNKEKYL